MGGLLMVGEEGWDDGAEAGVETKMIDAGWFGNQ